MLTQLNRQDQAQQQAIQQFLLLIQQIFFLIHRILLKIIFLMVHNALILINAFLDHVVEKQQIGLHGNLTVIQYVHLKEAVILQKVIKQVTIGQIQPLYLQLCILVSQQFNNYNIINYIISYSLLVLFILLKIIYFEK